MTKELGTHFLEKEKIHPLLLLLSTRSLLGTPALRRAIIVNTPEGHPYIRSPWGENVWSSQIAKEEVANNSSPTCSPLQRAIFLVHVLLDSMHLQGTVKPLRSRTLSWPALKDRTTPREQTRKSM